MFDVPINAGVAVSKDDSFDPAARRMKAMSRARARAVPGGDAGSVTHRQTVPDLNPELRKKPVQYKHLLDGPADNSSLLELIMDLSARAMSINYRRPLTNKLKTGLRVRIGLSDDSAQEELFLPSGSELRTGTFSSKSAVFVTLLDDTRLVFRLSKARRPVLTLVERIYSREPSGRGAVRKGWSHGPNAQGPVS